MVRRLRGELPAAGVDRLEHREEAQLLAPSTNVHLGRPRLPCDPCVRHAGTLRAAEAITFERSKRGPSEVLGVLPHLRHLVDEPRVHRRRRRDLVHRVASVERPLDQVEPALPSGTKSRQRVAVGGRDVRGPEIRAVLLETSPCLPERFLEGASDRHHLAHRLHRRREHGVRLRELLEGEPRNLDDHVVERRLERCRRLARDVVADLIQPIADGEQRRDLRDGEPGGLRGECRRTAHARVHLDQHPAPGDGIHRELHVGSAGLDADRSQAREGVVSHRLILAVREGLLRRSGDGVPGVDAHGIDVLDRADDDSVVGVVAHHLELELLPASDRLLDKDLGDGARDERAPRQRRELLTRRREPAPSPAERERRPDDHREPDLVPEGQRLLEGACDPGARHVQTRLRHRLLESAAVLRSMDRLQARADQLDTETLEVS